MVEENIKFDAEVGKILQLMIHSLYANKDIFLREIVSNASDACDKVRYLALTNPDLISQDHQFKITLSVDEEKKILHISDNGIGMNRQDLIENIGTIAKSGTQGFLAKLTGDTSKDLQLIGQFGVGFYSGFMVANQMDVVTRKAGEKEVWYWSSKGEAEYSLKQLEDESHARGTTVTLHIKDDQDVFLDKFRLKHIIKTYSDHIAFPIEFIDHDGNIELLNNASAIWTRPKSEISEEQYKEFYTQVAHLPDSPWMIIHNKNEGLVEYTNLMFIPSTKPFDLFNPDRKSKLKLYVKKVFIGSEGIDLAPSYMRFLHGVIDSEDLPLNISRETLQHNHSLEKIRKSVTKKVIHELKNKMEKDEINYQLFWSNFGAVLKEGLCEGLPLEEKEKLLEVCLFRSAIHNKMININQYIENMKEGQENIFYLSGDNSEKLMNSPQIEGFLKRGIDVLLFVDTVDDFWVSVMHTFKDKELKSVTRSGIELDKIIQENHQDDKQEEMKEDYQNLVEYFKSTLSKLVADVKVSSKLVDSPVCLAVAEGAMDIRMERYLKDQKQLHSGFAKILEINVKHPIISKINNELSRNNKELAEELVLTLFDQACIIEGEAIADIGLFSRRISNLLARIN